MRYLFYNVLTPLVIFAQSSNLQNIDFQLFTKYLTGQNTGLPKLRMAKVRKMAD
jgi:hypothetical protein